KHFLPLHEGPYLKISISDQGTGIPEDVLPKIFDPYFTTKPKGSGLGLASAYSIIKNHLGHMTVESELGVGTTFSIFLPANPHVQMMMGKQEESITQVGNGKILIMDDEPTIRAVLGEMLHLCGYEWEGAKNGSEAITLYQQAKDSKQPFAVVILDLTVPGEKGGKEVIKGLLQIDPRVKAIVVSGYSNDPVMADFRTYGFSGVVTKPFRLTELSQAVHQVITGSTK
ncbi:MAG: response regulator, partial [Nitrospirota bacterium]|nr:response regulator [Nitrospirota bacterium]